MIENEVESIIDYSTRQETAEQIADNLLTDAQILHNCGGYKMRIHMDRRQLLAKEGAYLNIAKGSPAYNSLYARLKDAVSANLSRTIDILQGTEIQPGRFGNLGPDSVLSPCQVSSSLGKLSW
jgi:hypothetical protein